MADIRIKDLATTASTTASDDFLAVDGTTNGTRKLSAATPSFATSVTVPGVVGPTSTNLTLTGGTTGASLVLGQGTTVGDLTFTPTGSATAGTLVLSRRSASAATIATISYGADSSSLNQGPGYFFLGTNSAIPLVLGTTGLERARIPATGNLLIGGTTDITGSGGLKVFGTTAASSTTTGALQVAGGVGVAGAGYFGGVLNVAGDASFSSGTFAMTGGAGSYGLTISNTSATTRLTTSFGGSSLGFRVNAAGSDQLTVSGSAVNVPLSTASTGVGTGALQVAGGIYAGAASVFADVNVAGILKLQPDTNNIDAGGWKRANFETNGPSNWYAGATTGASTPQHVFKNRSATTLMTLYGTGNADFAGAVAIGNTVNTVSPTSPNRTVTMVIGGVTYYLAAKTTND